jgi:Na+-transporting methylmalonyl-CoA/oxaloacetate decarboxylase gamma subunit
MFRCSWAASLQKVTGVKIVLAALSGLALLVAAASAAERGTAAPGPVKQDAVEQAPESPWAARTHAALRRESSTRGLDQEQAIRDLAALYTTMEKAKGIDPAERTELCGLIRGRLSSTADRIGKRLAKQSKGRAESAQPAHAVQRAGGGKGSGEKLSASGSSARYAGGTHPGAGGGQQVVDHGLELVELIQHTIAPSTWDVNGGNGTIVYFAPRQALVVRQTAEVHGDLLDVIRNLRD